RARFRQPLSILGGCCVWLLRFLPLHDTVLAVRVLTGANGKLDANAEASALAISEINVSAVFPYDRTSDGQTETDPTSARITSAVNSVEWLEHLLPFAPWDSRPFILNGDHDAPGLGGKRYVGLTSVLDGIVHEVGDRPPHGRRPITSAPIPG
ncbi:MAG: hypothetical protein ABSG83_18350, partial [Roseiarcus sp.]